MITRPVSDIRCYRIPNLLCGVLFLLFPLAVATSPHPVAWMQNLAVFGLISVVGFALFLGKVMGAGDIKLLSVASLWAGSDLIASVLLVTAFIGGVESIIMGITCYLKRSRSGTSQNLLRVQIPYGVAIATGGLVMLGKMAQPVLLPG